jgi:hypothetical protein
VSCHSLRARWACLSVCQVLWRGESRAGGFISVVAGGGGGRAAAPGFVVLKCDHSILGGIYTSPPAAAGQSVFDIFYLQEAARCMPS